MKKLLRITLLAAILSLSGCAAVYQGYLMEEDVARFGKPDDFHYHGSTHRTYIWYCANGLYRSHTYERQVSGHWVRMRVYSSSCIR